ncbi:MAPEG family protein [Sphingomonas antarctica]|uniref:MAPEG family protein n=1 Tax=Sphingomonas antarctica TaxID=2040274 RepID=UPI0039E848FB
MHAEILKPVAVLIAWTLVIFVLMIARRFPAMKAAGIDLSKARGGKPGALDGVVPESAQWPAHNYMHLVEQPTIFYAVALLLAIVGMGNGPNANLAWAYVGLRIIHSLIQVTANIIKYRFLVFLLSTIVLTALTIHALMAVFA